MVRKLAVVVVTLGAWGVLGVAAAPAGASCVGPRVRYDPAAVARGEKVTISGEFWGDACNDEQIRGREEPVLGDPIEKITISLLQDGRRIVVARGAADENYEFVVKVRIPRSLQPGGANVIATQHREPSDGGDIDHMTDELQITDAPPTRRTGKVTVVKFGR
jgi:hypothetical protein